MGSIKHKRTPNSLRKYRRAKGLTQKEVAKILGLKEASAISRWERGFRVPKLITAIKLSILYNTMADGLYLSVRRELKDEISESLNKVRPENKK